MSCKATEPRGGLISPYFGVRWQQTLMGVGLAMVLWVLVVASLVVSDLPHI